MSNSPGAGPEDLCALLVQLAALPEKVEWVEFKANFKDPEEIGQYLSALSNSAALKRKPKAYMIWGVEDQTHRLIGTTFRPRRTKKGNEDLESWLCRLLEPRLHFQFHEIQYIGLSFVLLEIPAAGHSPVRFKNVEYIRIGSYKHKLSDYVEKERELWSLFLQRPQFEHGIAKICEERGSGIDKVFFEVEMYQLPAPDFTVNHDHTVSVLLAPRPLAQMGRTDRIRACYQHAGLQFVSYKRMTNASLRERLNIADRNHAIASRIIGDTLEVGLVKPFDPENRSKRLAQYVPFWA